MQKGGGRCGVSGAAKKPVPEAQTLPGIARALERQLDAQRQAHSETQMCMSPCPYLKEVVTSTRSNSMGWERQTLIKHLMCAELHAGHCWALPPPLRSSRPSGHLRQKQVTQLRVARDLGGQ